ncbi:MAG TPA: fatty acid desaturase [Candidatus Limnocylindria bacterium]|nr:fatty acid desaturase [Candidatus Limnocylindria bacterium]
MGIPTRLNIGIIVAQLMAVAACFYGAAHLRGNWSLAGLTLAFAVAMNSVYASIHEAEHGILFRNSRWNDAVGAFLSLFFPAPFHLLRQGHLGHHFRNRSDDEAFDLYFEGDHRVWRYLILYGILTGCYWLVVVLGNLVFLFLPFASDKKYWKFDRPSAAFAESLNPSYRRIIQLECLAVLALHAGVVYFLHVPVLTYVVMYFGFGFSWSAMQYVHHYGTERHVTRGARNLRLWEPLDRLWLNHNWHRVHHEHPTVPWVHLPTLGQATQLGKRGFLPWFYLQMWRGPRKATEHVENRYAGRVIR